MQAIRQCVFCLINSQQLLLLAQSHRSTPHCFQAQSSKFIPCTYCPDKMLETWCSTVLNSQRRVDIQQLMIIVTLSKRDPALALQRLCARYI